MAAESFPEDHQAIACAAFQMWSHHVHTSKNYSIQYWSPVRCAPVNAGKLPRCCCAAPRPCAPPLFPESSVRSASHDALAAWAPRFRLPGLRSLARSPNNNHVYHSRPVRLGHRTAARDVRDRRDAFQGVARRPSPVRDDVPKPRRLHTTPLTAPRRRDLARFCDNEKAALVTALSADLGRSSAEAAMEVASAVRECNEARRAVGGWMVPEQVSTNGMVAPAHTEVRREPHGVRVCLCRALPPEPSPAPPPHPPNFNLRSPSSWRRSTTRWR